MTLDELHKEWSQDAPFDSTNLGAESLKIPRLHSKYWRYLTNEKMGLIKLDAEFKRLKLEKFEFYTQGPTPEQKAKGWESPAIGRVANQVLPTYMDADKQLIDLTMSIGVQREKIELLESIIKHVSNRGFLVKNYLDYQRLQSGA